MIPLRSLEQSETESGTVASKGWEGWGEVIVQWVQNFSFARFRVLEIDDGDGFPTMCICSNITALHTGLPHYLEVEHSHNTFR